jgi:hypothetical protein
MPFFPSCIMDLGALASFEYAACGDTPIYSCAGLLRPRLVSTLPLAAPRIFDNCIYRHQPAGRRSHAPVGQAIACSPASLAAARAIRRSRAKRRFTRTTPCPSNELCYSSFTGGVNPWNRRPIHRTHFWPQKARVPNEPNPTIGQSPDRRMAARGTRRVKRGRPAGVADAVGLTLRRQAHNEANASAFHRLIGGGREFARFERFEVCLEPLPVFVYAASAHTKGNGASREIETVGDL